MIRALIPLWIAAGTASLLPPTLHSAILINEADPQNRGEQTTGSVNGDFVELRATNNESSLNGLHLVAFDGIDARSYSSYELNGFSFNDGFLLIATYGIPQPDLIIHRNAGTRDPFDPGSDGLLLTSAPVAPATLVTSVDSATFVDGVVHRELAFNFAPGSLGALMQNTILLPGNAPVTEGANQNAVTNPLAARDDSFGRMHATPGAARTTNTYEMGSPSPGKPNNRLQARLKLELWVPAASPSVSKTTLSEATATDRVQARLTRFAIAPATSPPLTSPLSVTLINHDRSEIKLLASSDDGPDLVTVTIPANANSVDFFIAARNDGWKDGTVRAYLAATAEGLTPAVAYVDVSDAEPAQGAPADIVITEVHGVPFGDANQDGVVDAGDQFLEILNTSSGVIDLEGYRLFSGGEVRHVFGYADQLLPNTAVVVFGNVGDDRIGITEGFAGTATVLKASTGGLGINRHGDVISLRGPNESGDTEKAGFVYWPYVGGSNTLNATLAAQTIGHKFVPGSNGQLFSPGTKADGTNYSTVTQRPKFSFSKPSVAALLPDGTSMVMVEVPGPWNYETPLKVVLENLTPAIATIPTTASISQGSIVTPNLPINHAQDIAVAAPPFARFRVVRAAGFLNGTDSGAEEFRVVATGKDVTSSSTATERQLVESAGSAAAAFTVSLTGALTAPMTLEVVSGSGLKLTPSPASIPSGQTSWTVALDAQSVEAETTVTVRGLAEAPDSRNFETTFVVHEDGGVAAGPFLNEFDPSPPAGGKQFVEILVPGNGATSLDPYTLVVFKSTGEVEKSISFGATAMTDAQGFFVVSEPGGQFVAPSLVEVEFTLPIAGGALAIYRSGQVTTLTGDFLLDAVVWGEVDATLRQTLLPKIVDAANQGDMPIAGDASDGLRTLGRPVAGATPADLRNPSKWSNLNFPTPGYANNGPLFKGWLAQAVGPGALPGGDPDSDGWSTLLEFVFGSSPTTPFGPGSPLDPLTLRVSDDRKSLTLDLAAVSSLALADPAHLKIELRRSTPLTPGSWTTMPWAKDPATSPVTGAAVVPLPPTPDTPADSYFRVQATYTD